MLPAQQQNGCAFVHPNEEVLCPALVPSPGLCHAILQPPNTKSLRRDPLVCCLRVALLCGCGAARVRTVQTDRPIALTQREK